MSGPLSPAEPSPPRACLSYKMKTDSYRLPNLDKVTKHRRLNKITNTATINALKVNNLTKLLATKREQGVCVNSYDSMDCAPHNRKVDSAGEEVGEIGRHEDMHGYAAVRW